jgi:hypothetical protein
MRALLRGMGLATVVLGVALIVAGTAQASVFTFSDEYYVNSLTTYHSIFGAATTGYGTAGIYQETNTTTPIVTKLSNGSGVPGEFIQDTTPNAAAGLSLNGWSQSLNNGQQVATVYNLGNPINGPIYMQYKTGVTGGLFGNGTTTAFTFNSVDLRGSTSAANLSFTLQGYLNGNLVDSTVLNVTGNTFSTYTLNWQNVDTVEIVSTTDLPVNWGSGTLYMDNVTINAVPEPATIVMWSLLGAGCVGVWRRRTNGRQSWSDETRTAIAAVVSRGAPR